MRSIQFTLLFLILVAMLGCEPPARTTEQILADQRVAANEVFDKLDRAIFVFDPTTQACYMSFSDYTGSLTQVSCRAAKIRMTPHLREMLENTEKALGQPIP